MLTVNDLMTAVPDTVTPETTLRHVIGIMKAGGFRQIPVLKDTRLVGIVTDRDIRLVMHAPVLPQDRSTNHELLDEVTVEAIMTSDPVAVSPDTPAYQAAEMLSMYKFGALPVVEGENLVGIITVTDFLNFFTRTMPGNS